jgi:hypothetical protein
MVFGMTNTIWQSTLEVNPLDIAGTIMMAYITSLISRGGVVMRMRRGLDSQKVKLGRKFTSQNLPAGIGANGKEKYMEEERS